MKEHIPGTDELQEALGLKPMSSISLALGQFKSERPIADVNGNQMSSYAKRRPLNMIAEELDISIHKLKRMIKVLKKEGPDGL